ncbi:hypothetical protein [Spirochaeta dissipatitropha]
MIREIIKPQEEIYKLHIPKEYLNTEIEILILPFSYPDNDIPSDVHLNESAGILGGKVVDPAAWQRQLREEYER